MIPNSRANGIEEQRLLLKQYLGQYYAARIKKRQLEIRLQTFRQDMVGTKGMQYSPVPRSRTNSVGDGPASMVVRAIEIEDRIESQKAEMNTTMLNVMKIMDFLPRVCQVFCVSFKKKFWGRENLPVYIIYQFSKLLR